MRPPLLRSPFKGRDALSKIAGGDFVAKAGSELVRDLGLPPQRLRGLPIVSELDT